MKKIVVMLFAMIALSTGAYAQLKAGAKAGLNLANFYGDDAGSSDIRLSFHFGGYLNYAITESFSFQPELLYNSVGARESADDPDFGEFDATMKLSYLSIPFMFIYSTGPINFQAGPQLGVLLDAKVKAEAMGQSVEVDMKDQFKTLDLGLNFGIGGDFGRVNASARYCLGLSNIFDEEDADLKNGVIQFSIGVKFFGD